jgi:EmrB/QacA subfamily drug resistance transporter
MDGHRGGVPRHCRGEMTGPFFAGAALRTSCDRSAVTAPVDIQRPMIPTPELSHKRRMLILAICCTSLFIVGIDTTIVNVALPTIHRELHAGVSDLQWTVDGYTLVLATLLMLSGSLSDRFGRRRMLRTGLTLFAAGSLLCSVAPTAGWLIVFRMLQAIGGSMLNPVAMSIIANVFSEPRERARALGVWAGTVGFSLAFGPLAGGLLLSTSLGWRSIFWINVPIACATAFLAGRFVPESNARRVRKPDPVGQLLMMTLFASCTYAIIEAPAAGWISVQTEGFFAIALVALVGVIVYEPRRAEPLVDLRFFASLPFAGALTMAFAAFAAISSFLFVNTLYLQDVRGFSPFHAGLLTLPLAAMTFICGPLSGRVVARHGPRFPLVLAGLAICVCGAMLTSLATDTSIYWLLAAYAACGFGFATINPPIGAAALAGLPLSQSGVAGALNSTSRQIGATLGIAISGSLISSNLHGSLHSGLALASHTVWWLVVGCGGVIAAIGLLSTSARARRSAVATAARLTPEHGPAAKATPALAGATNAAE